MCKLHHYITVEHLINLEQYQGYNYIRLSFKEEEEGGEEKYLQLNKYIICSFAFSFESAEFEGKKTC